MTSGPEIDDNPVNHPIDMKYISMTTRREQDGPTVRLIKISGSLNRVVSCFVGARHFNGIWVFFFGSLIFPKFNLQVSLILYRPVNLNFHFI